MIAARPVVARKAVAPIHVVTLRVRPTVGARVIGRVVATVRVRQRTQVVPSLSDSLLSDLQIGGAPRGAPFLFVGGSGRDAVRTHPSFDWFQIRWAGIVVKNIRARP